MTLEQIANHYMTYIGNQGLPWGQESYHQWEKAYPRIAWDAPLAVESLEAYLPTVTLTTAPKPTLVQLMEGLAKHHAS